MALSKRERILAIVTAVAVAALAVNERRERRAAGVRGERVD